MVSLTSFLSFATLATCSAVAAPIWLAASESAVLEARNVYYCRNVAMRGGGFSVAMDHAVATMHGTPHSKGKSGYPHPFQNLGAQPLTFETEHCNHGNLLEFPISLTGHPYNADSHKRNRDDPGPARVLFVQYNQPYPQRLFCGVVAHVGEGTNPNAGRIDKCHS